MKKIAFEIHSSEGYLSRCFMRDLGISVSDYVRRQKIQLAEQLLRESELTSIEIASLLSYSSQSHFIQQFKHWTGRTPREYKSLSMGKKMW